MIFVQTNIICAVIYIDCIKIIFVLNKFIPWRNNISGSIYIVRSLLITLLNWGGGIPLLSTMAPHCRPQHRPSVQTFEDLRAHPSREQGEG